MLLVGASGNDPKNDFEIFLKNYAWLLCLIVVAIIAITIVVIFIIKNRRKGRGKKLISKAPVEEWLIALGGKENILDIYSTGSRLSAKIDDTSKVNREALKELGVSSIVMMSDKITLVTNLDNEKIVESIKSSLE